MDSESTANRAAIAENYLNVRSRVEAACRRAGRDPGDVTLIAVSKKKPFSDIAEAYAAGARDFGENYVQELRGKIQEWEGRGEEMPLRWHMIGHLQKNKVKNVIGSAALIHSVDSVELAEQIEKDAARTERTVDILMEVNAAAEDSKWGFSIAETAKAAREIQRLEHIRLRGLMTSAPYTLEPESNRVYFRVLRELAVSLDEKGLIDHTGDRFKTPVLSMGMTGDYEVAVEEGATMVRVGTGIFGERG